MKKLGIGFSQIIARLRHRYVDLLHRPPVFSLQGRCGDTATTAELSTAVTLFDEHRAMSSYGISTSYRPTTLYSASLITMVYAPFAKYSSAGEPASVISSTSAGTPLCSSSPLR